MGNLRSIEIVGGGLAGLALGIGLRRHGVPVIIWEAGHYPRHRVCGEFISGRGQETLVRLGFREYGNVSLGQCQVASPTVNQFGSLLVALRSRCIAGEHLPRTRWRITRKG